MFYVPIDVDEELKDYITDCNFEPVDLEKLLEFIKENYVKTPEQVVEDYCSFMEYKVDLGIVDYGKVISMVKGNYEELDCGDFLDLELMYDEEFILRSKGLIK